MECRRTAILKTYSEIFKDIAQVSFASIFVGPLVGGNFNGWMFVSGLAFSFGSWIYSIYLINRIYDSI